MDDEAATERLQGGVDPFQVGAYRDITLADLAVEVFFPGDAAIRQGLQAPEAPTS